MALLAPIAISEQARQIAAVLEPYATASGGFAGVVSNLQMLWAQASMDSEKPRLLICYNGENSRGDFSVANRLHRVDRQWVVAVTRGRGWRSNRGASLYQTTGNADPFYDVVEEVRELLREMLGISEEFPIDFKRISPMSSGNKALDSYAIEFSTANDIPAILMRPDDRPTNP
jgi:hypothetical protein